VLATLADAGFDLVHAFDTASLANDPQLAALADPARRFGLLVGNTRALWPRFLTARRADAELAACDDPLDRYTERALARAFPDERIWFAHAQYDGAFLPIQRLAAAVGLAFLAPTHLVIHPTYGPWIALRGVITLVGDPPPAREAMTAPCQCESACTSALARAMCSEAPADWIALRDSCTIGRNHRYAEDQLSYHYTKDRSLLR
jgi:methylmalonic aciduria homocystinuria type C protein